MIYKLLALNDFESFEKVRRRANENAPRGRVYMILVAPQGFEPRLIESESTVLPLNEGAI